MKKVPVVFLCQYGVLCFNCCSFQWVCPDFLPGFSWRLIKQEKFSSANQLLGDFVLERFFFPTGYSVLLISSSFPKVIFIWEAEAHRCTHRESPVYWFSSLKTAKVIAVPGLMPRELGEQLSSPLWVAGTQLLRLGHCSRQDLCCQHCGRVSAGSWA